MAELKFNEGQVVNERIHLVPKIDENNGITKVILDKVEVAFNTTDTVNDKGEPSAYEYTGIEVPTLYFRFIGWNKSATAPQSFFDHSEKVIVSMKNDGTPTSADSLVSLYQSMADRINHIFFAYKNSPNFSIDVWNKEVVPAGKALFAGISTDTANRAKLFAAFFTAVANAFNTGKEGKAIYSDIPMWLKIIADRNKGTYYVLPTFVGKNLDDGFIETVKASTASVLRIKPNESIVLQVKPKAAAPGATDDSPGDGGGLSDDVKRELGLK